MEVFGIGSWVCLCYGHLRVKRLQVSKGYYSWNQKYANYSINIFYLLNKRAQIASLNRYGLDYEKNLILLCRLF